jgi:hypothetical protein
MAVGLNVVSMTTAASIAEPAAGKWIRDDRVMIQNGDGLRAQFMNFSAY